MQFQQKLKVDFTTVLNWIIFNSECVPNKLLTQGISKKMRYFEFLIQFAN